MYTYIHIYILYSMYIKETIYIIVKYIHIYIYIYVYIFMGLGFRALGF